MSRRSITEGLQPQGPRQLSPAEQAFKETGTVPGEFRQLKSRQHENMTTWQHESVIGSRHEHSSSVVAPNISVPTPEATKQITVRIPVSMWSALIQQITENKAQGAALSSQQELIQHLIQQWLNQRERERLP